jgi:hypothetical protein
MNAFGKRRYVIQESIINMCELNRYLLLSRRQNTWFLPRQTEVNEKSRRYPTLKILHEVSEKLFTDIKSILPEGKLDI